MVFLLFKWLMVFVFAGNPGHILHPVYISVTEIDYNKGGLEISTRIFTDDFEKTLRKNSGKHVDLIQPADRKAMESLINDYLQQHLQVNVNGQLQKMQLLGFEQIDEAIYSYFEVKNVAQVKTLEVRNNILYDYEQRQVNVMHITVNGKRESTKLNYPDERLSLQF